MKELIHLKTNFKTEQEIDQAKINERTVYVQWANILTNDALADIVEGRPKLAVWLRPPHYPKPRSGFGLVAGNHEIIRRNKNSLRHLHNDKWHAMHLAARLAKEKPQWAAGSYVFDATELITAERHLNKIHERQCNGYQPENIKAEDRDNRAEEKIQNKVKNILKNYDAVPYFQDDPRGCALYIFFQDHKDESRAWKESHYSQHAFPVL